MSQGLSKVSVASSSGTHCAGSNSFGDPVAGTAPSSSPRCGSVPSGTVLAVCELLHIVAAALPAPLRALSPADIPASLSARVFNEEINADLGMTAHSLLVGHFPS